MLSGERKEHVLFRVNAGLTKEAVTAAAFNPFNWGRHAVAAPFKSLTGGVKNLLFGKTQHSGRFANTRMRRTGNVTSISKSEHNRLLREAELPQGQVGTGKFDPKTGAEIMTPGGKGHKVPEVFSQKGPGGEMQYFKQQYRSGGLTGLVQKHPLITAGVGGLGYLLLKNKDKLKRQPTQAPSQAPGQGAYAGNQVQSMAVQNPWG